MQLMRFGSPLVFALALAAGSPSSAAAQSAIAAADIQRLQDTVFDASRHINQVRSWDGSTAATLQAELDDVFDETIYMKVKLRKHEPVSRRDFAGVRDRFMLAQFHLHVDRFVEDVVQFGLQRGGG